MKKHLLITAICLLTLTIGHGQSNVYHPFPDSNAVWAIQWSVSVPPNGVFGVEYYSIMGDDTIVNALTYKKLYYNNTFIGGIRQNTAAKKVYFIAFSTNFPACPGKCYKSECLLYDFNTGVGDTVFYGLDGPRNKVASIDSIKLSDGTYRKRFKEDGYPFREIIEGIGSDKHLLCGSPGMTYFNLICFKQNNTTLYFQPTLQNSFCPTLTSVHENKLAASSLIISPNPFFTRVTLQAENPFYNATLMVCNYFGQTVKQIKNISGQTVTFSRDNLPSGLYFIRLMQDNKLIATEKLVIIDN
jgi:Secretion system C-terminal sorting domain